MKKLLFLPLVALVACFTDWEETSPDAEATYQPVLMERDAMIAAVKVATPREISMPGKIYVFGNYIFLSELFEGVHIINNADPANPKNISFLVIPGNVDIAVQGNSLFANSATDLISFDISDPVNAQLLDRKENVFPEFLPPNLDYIPEVFQESQRPDNTIIVKWEKI